MDNIINEKMLKSALELYENNWLDSLSENKFETSQHFEKSMQSLIDSQSSVYRKMTLTKTRKVIAVLAAALVVLLSALSVSAIRETILSFFVNRGDVRVLEYDLSESADYPKSIETAYSLTAVPEGYALSDSADEDKYSYRLYTRGDDFLSVEQFTKDSYKSASDLDSMQKEEYDGTEYVVQNDDGAFVLIWEKDGYVFEMTGFLEKSEMFSAAASVEPERWGEN